MVKIKEAIVVEGKYDKNTLRQVVDTAVFQFPRTEGNPVKLIDDIVNYSYINTGIVPTTEDSLVTFSTCYMEDSHRFVIIGVLRDLYRE